MVQSTMNKMEKYHLHILMEEVLHHLTWRETTRTEHTSNYDDIYETIGTDWSHLEKLQLIDTAAFNPDLDDYSQIESQAINYLQDEETMEEALFTLTEIIAEAIPDTNTTTETETPTPSETPDRQLTLTQATAD